MTENFRFFNGSSGTDQSRTRFLFCHDKPHEKPQRKLARIYYFLHYLFSWSYGVMVSTQDSESCDPSSNLGRTYYFFILMFTTVVNLSRSVFVRFGYQWWLIILERLDCTGTVIGPFTKQILTHSKCCPSDATLIVSHGISGSFVLRISRRYHNGKLQCRARNVHLYTNKVIFASGQSYRAFG